MGVKLHRKGYIHALEGVIAALIVVVYLSSILSVPETTDWETARISKKSEDLLSALDRSGFLDRTVLRGDSESFAAFVNALDSSIFYSMKLSGLPKRYVDVGVLVKNSSTYIFSTQEGRGGGTELPDSEGGRYRHGNLNAGPPFGDVPFVISDTVYNDIRGYTSVNFDFNGNGEFGDRVNGVDEGPYNFTDRFPCNSSLGGCSGSQAYEVGEFNTTLLLYNGTTAESLADLESNTSIGRRSVELSYETVNPFYRSVENLDVLWVEDWSAAEMENSRSLFEEFLRRGHLLFIHSAVDSSEIDSNYLSTLGFDYLQGYGLEGSGGTRNVLYSVHGPRNSSYRSAQYYLDSTIRIDGLTDEGGYLSGTVTVRGNDIEFRVSGETVSFETESFSIDYREGETVILEGNSYRIEKVRPLVLNPSGEQGFDSFETEKIDADYHVTRMEGREYNITDHDTSAQFDQKFQNRSDLPQDYSDGPVNTPCDWEDYPYKFGDVVVEGIEYNFSLVNFEPQTPCDQYFEFAYFDFNQDGDFDDDNLVRFSEEGPYQSEYIANISGSRYEVSPHLDGDGIDLIRVGQRLVGEFPVSRDVFGRGGSAALVRRGHLGNDDMHLIASLMAVETQEELVFSRSGSLGTPSLSYSYTSSAGVENSYG
ncbi:MAG: hypothetical protein SVS85_00960, partial [Candidatus Nanohaloarchaea archaeon]|nr:hypothetical protein [Candidatus Nanohaloarchaea archaeon]